jgi:predicted acyltransferase (DUF342 family)
MNEAVVYAMFAAALVLPGLPALAELRSRSDATALHIDPDYAMDPRYLGKSFRRKIARILDAPATTAHVPFLARARERARIVDALAIGSGTRLEEAVLSSGDVRTGAGVQLTDLYCAGSVRIGEGSSARTIAADGSVTMGERASIARWVDAERDVTVGAHSTIGHSACAGGICRVARAVAFGRLFGNPVIIGPQRDAIVPEPAPVFEGDTISARSVEIETGARVPGSVKSEGDVVVRADAHIAGSIVARGSVHIERGAAVSGHVFSERNVSIAASAVVGAPGSSKTVYASGDVTLSEGATVYGWIISEGRGVTV